MRLYEEQSAVGATKVYSDKPHTTVWAHSVSLYPSHVTLLNFTEECRRENTSSARTIVVYLPVQIKTFNTMPNTTTSAIEVTSKINRVLTLQALYLNNNNAMQSQLTIVLTSRPNL